MFTWVKEDIVTPHNLVFLSIDMKKWDLPSIIITREMLEQL